MYFEILNWTTVITVVLNGLNQLLFAEEKRSSNQVFHFDTFLPNV